MSAGARTDTDRGRFYTHPVTGEQLVSVTTVLGATDNKASYLVPWSARLAAEFAVDNLAMLVELVKEKGRQDAVDLVKDQAKQLRERKADAGTYVHDVAEALILWAASPEGAGPDIALPTLPEHLVGAEYDDEPLEDVVDWMIAGFMNFVAVFKPEFEAAEMAVYNRDIGVAGTLDTILRLRGVAVGRRGGLVPAPGRELRLCVDFKTGKYLDSTVQEQVSAYRRMREALMPLGEVVPMPETDAGAVLHLRPEHRDGYRLMPISPADDAVAWNRFRRAVELQTGRAKVGRKPGRVAYPLRPDGAMPAPLLADLDGEGYGRALGALLRSGLTSLDEVAAFTSSNLREVKGIGVKTVDMVRRMLADYGYHLADELPTTTDKAA